MRPAAVLLDLDGTLADSAPGILGSHRAALRELGHEPDPQFDMNFVIGPALPDVIPVVLAHYGDDRVEAGIEAYRRHYGITGVTDAAAYPGIEPMLQALAAAGCRMFLATAKRVDFARQMLEHLGLSSYFAGIYGSVPGGALDHKPELIAHIIAQEGLAAADTVMVGDRRYDITGAHANGMRAIGALWGYGGRAELEQAGADGLVENPAALTTALLDPAAATIRRAERGDLPGILELYRSFNSFDPAFDAVAAEPTWRALQASGLVKVVVAEVLGVIASSCTLAIVPNLTWSGHPYAVIENVVTHPGYRRTGLGLRVMAFASDIAWAAGCYKITLSTGSQQEGTLRFYESAGMVRGAKTFFEARRPI